MKFLTLPLTEQKAKEEGQKSNPTFQSSYSSYQLLRIHCFYHLWSDSDENLKNKNQRKILNLNSVTSNKLFFQRFHKSFKCTANKQRKLKLCLFTSLGMLGPSIWQREIGFSILILVNNIFNLIVIVFMLQFLLNPVNLSTWMLFWDISISSFFNFFWNDLFQEPFMWHEFMFFLSPTIHIKFFSNIRARY